MSKNSNKISYQGVFPIAPTPFQEDGRLDLDSQKRVLDCMIDQGVDGICILANYSEQFLLSDEERDILLDLCLNYVAGRVPVIVTCSHFSSRIACERAKKSEAAGAKMLMLMPPYHGAALKADEKGIYEHFQQISEAVSIPIMIQDAPLSGVSLSVDLLVRMARELTKAAREHQCTGACFSLGRTWGGGGGDRRRTAWAAGPAPLAGGVRHLHRRGG